MTYTNSYEKVMEDTHNLNPYVVMRKNASLTQGGLADILDMSEQVVRKLEYGLFAGHNPSVTRELIDSLPGDYHLVILAHLTSLGMTNPEFYRLASGGHGCKTSTTTQRIELVALWYTLWQKYRRHAIGRLLKANGFELPLPALMPEDFMHWVMSYLNDAPATVFEFCKALSLHPYTVQRWLTRTGATGVPPSLVGPLTTVLAEVDVDLDDVVFARVRVTNKA